MRLSPEILRANRSRIIARWGESILATYPDGGSTFFSREADAFRNPVGSLVRRGVEVLYDGLLGDAAAEDMEAALDGIVRVRSVQDFTPARAVGFVFLLKRAVRDVLAGQAAGEDAEQLREFDERIDDLALRAFDQFARCREKVYEIRAREVMARTHSLLRRAGVVEDGPGDAGEGGGGRHAAPDPKGGLEG